MTLSDLERRDARATFSRWISLIKLVPFNVASPNSTRNTGGEEREGRVSRWPATSCSVKGSRVPASPTLWDLYISARGLYTWETVNKFCMMIKLKDMKCFTGSNKTPCLDKVFISQVLTLDVFAVRYVIFLNNLPFNSLDANISIWTLFVIKTFWRSALTGGTYIIKTFFSLALLASSFYCFVPKHRHNIPMGNTLSP